MDRMKRCPYCGSKELFMVEGNRPKRFIVIHGDPFACRFVRLTMKNAKTREDAIREWNAMGRTE